MAKTKTRCCSNCTLENAGRDSPYGRNCRRLFAKYAKMGLDAVISRDNNLTRWHAPVTARLTNDESRVVVLRRKRAA